jgi:hypothetical protein
MPRILAAFITLLNLFVRLVPKCLLEANFAKNKHLNLNES